MAQPNAPSALAYRSVSLHEEPIRSVLRGIEFLKSKQEPNGAWLPVEQPAVSGLVLVACLGEPTGQMRKERPPFIGKGIQFLLSNRKPNGSFCTTNYQTYNTGAIIEALQFAGLTEYAPTIKEGRTFLSSLQLNAGKEAKTENLLDGGIGYGDGTPRANLANTRAALEALYLTRPSGNGSIGETPFNRNAMLAFLHRCQNLSYINSAPWVNEDESQRGGFIYHPEKSMAGDVKLKSGKSAYRVYGSMSYAGLLCYLYIGVPKTAPEVQAVFHWIEDNFTVESNPGLEREGLFFYYDLMAKALTLYGADTIRTRDGRKVNWRDELTATLLKRQQPDGSWVNPSERWMEKNPVLVTAYAISTLNTIATRKH